ncbi:unnamed protein product [Adineta ricciae]|uniref:Uncharacterized protein n=1 Tax=Adineta ricciae TaxID=249248 RepID=A0A815EGG4_ADIRI|nr:unnamed protein product [Adineta ricciae]CAF1309695.1 unnamed protein product [Adineta ricciae]
MEQQNNASTLNDSAGVLPMDTDAATNGVHDQGKNNRSSANVNAKRGRGRPPKSAGTMKVIKNANEVKRGRGRPSKTTGETSSTKKAVLTTSGKNEQPSANGNANKKKRGRPSKNVVAPTEQISSIVKPQVRANPVEVPKETDSASALEKKKRGRPSGSSPKKVVKPAKSPISTETSSGRRRGRPSGSVSAKKSALKAKPPAKSDSIAKKRGRPKKLAAELTPVAVASAASSSANTTNNV